MTAETREVLEDGWLPTTPTGDTVLRRFLHNQADVNSIIARASSGAVERTDGVVLTDARSPVALLNQALLTAPVLRTDDPVLDSIEAFFADGARPATVLSVWPTPDMSDRGWSLVGHPVFVVRAPGPVSYERRDGVEIRVTDDLATAERIVIDGFPLEEAHAAPPGAVLGPGVVGTGLAVRLGLLDGEPVAVGEVFVGHGVANLCVAATLPAARRRGVWEALVWARVATAPELPAVAYTSDYSRPGFERMGFLPITRFTLWRIGAGQLDVR